ncbi:hypothetical protein Anas_13649 [Armadillidium nasatum]|uniref:Uncharacterized protein n=1 Tax=Armadillidium nasatum TaxID=96803 RepID=A0A5N5TAH9_9CRUS|nr:hypothetical protein Anas_13649 [Armadillidium nasatum]
MPGDTASVPEIPQTLNPDTEMLHLPRYIPDYLELFMDYLEGVLPISYTSAQNTRHCRCLKPFYSLARDFCYSRAHYEYLLSLFNSLFQLTTFSAALSSPQAPSPQPPVPLLFSPSLSVSVAVNAPAMFEIAKFGFC